MSNPNPPAALPRGPRWLHWVGWIALVIYALFLWRNFSGAAAGADSSGYLNSARILASGHLATELRVPPEFGPQMALRRQQFQPHGFVPFDDNPRLSPTYPVGLPLHLALAGKIFGWSLAPYVVGVGGAVAALLLSYAVARQLGLDAALAMTAAAVLAAYPVFIFMAVQPLSDVLATTWCLAAIAAALRAHQTGHARWALACGAAFAIAVLVRATNVLILPALIVLLGLNLRRLVLAALGAVPGALWLGYYNHTLYGGALRSGYVDLSQAFGWSYGGPTAWHFLKWFALLLPAILLILPFVAARRAKSARRPLLAFALWFGALTTLYVFYSISHEVWWDLRFILPATPTLILAALLGVDAIARSQTEKIRRRFIPVTAAVIATWAIGLGWFWTAKFHLLLTKTYEQAYADASIAARAKFPANALVVAGLNTGALYYYTDFAVLRWDFVNREEFAHFLALTQAARRPVCAVLFDLEEREALQQNCPGDWVRVGTVKNIGLWQLGPPRAATP